MVKKHFSSRLARISLLATLASTLLSQGASAKIPLTAFKNITICFKKGKEFFSPTLGEAAIESHLIDTYRFYGNYTAVKDKSGNPLHAEDVSNGDPIWDMVRIFFPSPAGQLNAESSRETNFGNNIDNVKTIAILLNYANDLREGNPVDEGMLKKSLFASLKSRPVLDTTDEETKRTSLSEALNDIKETKVSDLNMKIQEVLKDEPDNELRKAINKAGTVRGKTITPDNLDKVKAEMIGALNTHLDKKIQQKNTKFITGETKFNGNLFKETLNPLLKSIQNAITGEKDLIYPEHTTEQVISSFFCYKFNTQQDIIDLMHNLDDSIVDKSRIPTQIAELKEEDLTDIASHSTYDMDDVLALETADIWGLLVPYRDGSAPLSNGNTYQYDRKNNRYLKLKGTIADCAEIAARHLINVLLYNQVTRDWDLSYIKKHIDTQSPGNKYFRNFEEFYKTQHPNLANAGDIIMRSLWNTVVGDLNAYEEGGNITYVQGTNELETGYINLIRVFEKIFDLPLKPFPAPIEGKEKEYFKAKKSWLQNSFEQFFTIMNPTRKYHMDLSHLLETEHEVSGYLPITVMDKQTSEKLFSFTFFSKYLRHSEVINIFTIKERGAIYTEDLKSHSTLIPVNTAEEAVWMLSPDAELKAQKILHPFYSLFNQEFKDNTAKINFLWTLNENYERLNTELLQTPQKVAAFKGMLGNILSDFSWDDFNEVDSISPVIFSLLEKGDFNDILGKTVKAIYFEEIIEDISGNIIQKLENLEDLYLPKQGFKNFSFLKAAHSHIKTIDVRESSIETLEGIENFPELKVLDLSSSAIKDLSGLGGANTLEELNVSNTKSLETLSFTQLNPQLKKINLRNSNIFNINNLGNCPNLEELDFGDPSKVKSISFNGPLNKLTKFELKAEDIKTLTGLDCPNLEEMTLRSHKLKELVIENPMPHLKTLKSQGSAVEEIKGLDHCPHLEELTILNARLKSLVVNEDLIHLKDISLHNIKTGISAFTHLLEKSPNLEILNIQGVGVSKRQDSYSSFDTGSQYLPEKLSFNGSHNALKTIEVIYSGIGEIEGLENCPNLEEINLQGTHIKQLMLDTEYSKLKKISLFGGAIQSLEGLDHCPNLKELDLTNAHYQGTLTFEKDNKDLVIEGVRKTQIRGIEHLDDKKILE